MPRLVVVSNTGEEIAEVEVYDRTRGSGSPWGLKDFEKAWSAGLAADERARQIAETQGEQGP